MQKSKLKRAVWALHIVVAVLCVLSIVAYFIIPFWSVKLSYTVKAEQVDKMIGDSVEFDAKEVVGEEGVKLSLSLEFKTAVLFKSYGNVDTAVDALIEDNVNVLVSQLTDTLNVLVEKVVRTVTSDVVSQQVHKNVRDLLADSNPEISDEEVTNRLNSVGITDKFIDSKTNAIIDKIYDGGSTVDDVCDEVVNTLDEIFAKMAQSDDPDLKTSQLKQEDKDALRKTMKETIENFASKDGTLDADELIASIFLQMLGSFTGSDSGEKSNMAAAFAADDGETGTTPDDGAADPAPGGEDETPAPDEEEEAATVRLKAAVRDFVAGMIPTEANMIVGWVMRGMTILFLFSSFWWAYILLKLFVKMLKRKKPKIQNNPTVRLWTPVVFGWSPFLIFVALPLIAMKALAHLLPAEIASVMSSAGVSFISAGIIPFIAAMLLFAIGIFNAVARKKLKKAAVAANANDAATPNPAAQDPTYNNGYYNNGYYNDGSYGYDGQNGSYDNSYYNNPYYGNAQYDNQYYNNPQYGNSQYDNQYYDNSYYDNPSSGEQSSDDSYHQN